MTLLKPKVAMTVGKNWVTAPAVVLVMITVARRYNYKHGHQHQYTHSRFFCLKTTSAKERRKTYPIVAECKFQAVDQSLVILISTSNVPFHSPNRNSLFSGAQPFCCSGIVGKNKHGDYRSEASNSSLIFDGRGLISFWLMGKRWQMNRRTSRMKSHRHDSIPSLPSKPFCTPAAIKPENAPDSKEPV